MNNLQIKVKGILLDLDGTIMDTRDAYIEAAKTAFSELGLTLPGTTVALEIPKRIEQRLSLTDLVNFESQKFLGMYLKAFYKLPEGQTKPLPYVVNALEELSRKAKLAIITMRSVSKELIIKELRQFNLDKYFTHIVTALDTPEPKPSPEALIKTVNILGLHIHECLIVGDSVIDIQAGKAAGATTVAVLSGLYSREELTEAEPNFILNNIAELPKLIE